MSASAQNNEVESDSLCDYRKGNIRVSNRRNRVRTTEAAGCADEQCHAAHLLGSEELWVRLHAIATRLREQSNRVSDDAETAAIHPVAHDNLTEGHDATHVDLEPRVSSVGAVAASACSFNEKGSIGREETMFMCVCV
jgi:hypothetical protein